MTFRTNYWPSIDVCVFVTLVPFCNICGAIFFALVVRQGNPFVGVKPNTIQCFNGILFLKTYVEYADIGEFNDCDFRERNVGNGITVGPNLDLKSYSRYMKIIDPTWYSTMTDKNLARDVAEISKVQDRMLLLTCFKDSMCLYCMDSTCHQNPGLLGEHEERFSEIC